MVAAANRDGYARATVSAVIAEAGVSRPTFYEYFVDRDDCFLIAQRHAQGRLLAEVRELVQALAPERAMQASIRALIRFAGSAPAMARFLMTQPLAGGPAALDARDRGIASIARLIERSHRRADPAAAIPDLPARAGIGGVHRLLASRLHRGEPNLSGLLSDLLEWIESYEQPAAEHRWRALKAGPRPPWSPFVPERALCPPDTLPPGRPRIPEDQVAENQRRRIMFAAARIAEEKGYGSATIGDITRIAGVDGRVFYRLFTDKQDAFMAMQELGFRTVMDVTASAFFAGATWTERHWEAGRAFTQFLERNPRIARVGFVEAHAIGPGAVQRLEDSCRAFAMLLREGYGHTRRTPPSSLALEAIITTIFETVYHEARASRRPSLSRLLPHFTFLVLAPFLGPVEANSFIDQKI
jgi:AcrR family transcriptional regulator